MNTKMCRSLWMGVAVTTLLLLLDHWTLLTTSNRPVSGDVIHCNKQTAIGVSYELARRQSGGFFDDISDKDWLLLQRRHALQFPNYGRKVDGESRSMPNHWYQSHFEPEFTCLHERRLGTKGDGGKWICDPHRIALQDQCLVYSIGSNGRISFEKDIKGEISSKCEVHTFDLDDGSGRRPFAKKLRPYSSFHHWGLGTSKQAKKEPAKYKTLRQTVETLGHHNRTIDILKIDCESCEWETYLEWFDVEKVGTSIRQILVEVHETPTRKFFFHLHDRGYMCFHKEPNIMGGNAGRVVEYAFVLVDKEFMGDNLYETLAPNGDS